MADQRRDFRYALAAAMLAACAGSAFAGCGDHLRRAWLEGGPAKAAVPACTACRCEAKPPSPAVPLRAQPAPPAAEAIPASRFAVPAPRRLRWPISEACAPRPGLPFLAEPVPRG